MKLRTLVCSALLTGLLQPLTGADRKTTIAPETVRQNFFLGQVYPSGNVYLKGFSDEMSDNAGRAWPVRVMFRGVLDEPASSRFQFADFKTELHDTVKGGVQYSKYFPGTEHMDDQHVTCGGEDEYTKNKAWGYLEPDFFLTGSAYCDSNKGVALYITKGKNTQSFRVVATGGMLQVGNIEISNGSKGRPLVAGEADEIAQKKRRGASTANDCTTIPAYIDDAVILADIAIVDSRTSLRLSSYENPGCMGHLETIYVLDVFEDQRHQKTFELRQSKGPV